MESEGVLPVKSSWSYLWFILPLMFGLLGGFIVYFILRKRDIKKANICLLIGLGISILWTVAIIATAESREPEFIPEESKVTPKKVFIEKTQEEKIAEQKIIDQNIALSLRGQQDTAKLVSDEEMDRRLAELESNKFAPIIVQSALENIPDMSLPREILKQCKAVKSFSDYLIFATAVAVMSEDLTQTLKLMDNALSNLELQGYDKHPKVGPLIREARSLAGESADCVRDLVSRYDN